MKKSTLFIGIMLMTIVLSAQWIQLPNPYPYDDTLREIYFVDQDHGFIGGHWDYGYGGDLRSTSDGGSTWDYSLYWLGIQPYRIFFTDETHGWIMEGGVHLPWFTDSTFRESSRIWRTIDGGFNPESWQELEATGLEEFSGLESIFFSDTLNGWLCGWNLGWNGIFGHVYSSVDGGNSWTQSGGKMGIVNDIFFINDSIGWVVGGSCRLTTDKGITWEYLDINCNGQVIQFIDENTGWIGGKSSGEDETGVIMKSVDGGNTWQQKISDSIPAINDLQFVDPLHGWAVGDSGLILYSNNGGETWEYQESGTISKLNRVSFVDKNNGWICGLEGTILRTDNGGIVGIQQQALDSNLNMHCYPNPFSTIVSIELELKQPLHLCIEIFNNQGRKINAIDNKTYPAGLNHISWNATHLPPGIYFLRLQAGEQLITKRLIKT